MHSRMLLCYLRRRLSMALEERCDEIIPLRGGHAADAAAQPRYLRVCEMRRACTFQTQAFWPKIASLYKPRPPPPRENMSACVYSCARECLVACACALLRLLLLAPRRGLPGPFLGAARAELKDMAGPVAMHALPPSLHGGRMQARRSSRGYAVSGQSTCVCFSCACLCLCSNKYFSPRNFRRSTSCPMLSYPRPVAGPRRTSRPPSSIRMVECTCTSVYMGHGVILRAILPRRCASARPVLRFKGSWGQRAW